jgi:hypothetical protein
MVQEHRQSKTDGEIRDRHCTEEKKHASLLSTPRNAIANRTPESYAHPARSDFNYGNLRYGMLQEPDHDEETRCPACAGGSDYGE